MGLGGWGAGGRGLEGVGLVEELRVIRWRAAGLLRGGGRGGRGGRGRGSC